MPARRDVLEYELSNEAATTLGAAGEKLERALRALRTFDAGPAGTTDGAPAARAALAADAAERLWIYVVQREAMGLTRHDRALDLLGVSMDLRRRMGPKSRRP